MSKSKNIICPHCQIKGKVKVKQVKNKKGLSGGKVMGGIVTGGVSLLATGLSRKEKMNEAKCSSCGVKWSF